MASVFDIKKMAAQIGAAKDKAQALAGAFVGDVVNGHVMPPIPFPYVGDGDAVLGADGGFDLEAIEGEADSPSFTIFGTPMCFPLSIKLKSESSWWLLPTEPMITLGGGSILVRRNVAKAKKLRGSIKDRWATDDYSINIEGLFTKFDEWVYPKEDVIKLRQMLEAEEPIDVKCEFLELFGIGRIVVEKYDFPFTKGEENQAYRLNAWSDDDWDLFIKK